MKYTVCTYEKEIGLGVIDAARKYGWCIFGDDNNVGTGNFIAHSADYHYIHMYTIEGHGKLEVGMVDFLARLRNGPIRLPICNLGQYAVEHTKDGIKVGCINITKDEIKKIYNAVFPLTHTGESG